MRLIILRGLPASGKTTFAKEFQKDHPTFKRINKDEIRAMLDNSVWSVENEFFVVEMRDLLIEKALAEQFDVIVDDTNLNPVHEQQIRDRIESYKSIVPSIFNVTIEVKDFTDVPLETCIERDSKREKLVGEKVIRDMYEKYLKGKSHEV